MDGQWSVGPVTAWRVNGVGFTGWELRRGSGSGRIGNACPLSMMPCYADNTDILVYIWHSTVPWKKVVFQKHCYQKMGHFSFPLSHSTKQLPVTMEAPATCRQWRLEDLVLAKVKGFLAWPAKVRQSIFHPHLFALIWCMQCMLLLFAFATSNYILLMPWLLKCYPVSQPLLQFSQHIAQHQAGLIAQCVPIFSS